MKKVLALSLALMMVLALVLTGCGGSGNQTTTTAAAATTAAAGDKTTAAATTAAPSGELVPVHWWSQSGSAGANDKDMVYDHMAAMFAEDVGVEMNFHFFTSAEYKQKMDAAMNAGQDADIVQNSISNGFPTNQKAGWFMPLDDLLKEYAPTTLSQIPQYCWDAVTIDGHIYAMPSYKDVAVSMGLIYNTTLVDSIGMTDHMKSLKWTVGSDLDETFYMAKEARDAAFPEWAETPIMSWRDTMHIYYQADQIASLAHTAIPGQFTADGDLSEGKTVFNVYATTTYADAIKLVTRWVNDGINAYDAKNYDPEGAIKKSGAGLGNFTWGTIAVAKGQYENFEQDIIQPSQTFTYTGYIQAALNTIATQSTAPEKAMQCLELIFSDPEYATTWRFGIEGTHWNKLEKDGKIRCDFAGTRNEDPQNRGWYLWYHAECGNLFNCYLPTNQDDLFYEKLAAMNDSSVASLNMGFNVNTDPVTNEIAAVSGVVSEYHASLISGMMPDVDATIATFVEKLNANGAEKIVSEIQTQLDAWYAAQ